jgi:protein-L-isoaspartate(D-aspartate) O-methyltransferase
MLQGPQMIDYQAVREAMVDTQVRTADVTRYPILDAMMRVPREEYLPEAVKPVAYLGEHVPLGEGRVLLDPRSFAKMLDALNVGPKDLVLDVGTGFGYSSAVLARMAEAVIALEEDADMAAEAEARLIEHGVDNAVVHRARLVDGAPEHGPYDAIIIEGGVEQVPEALTGQLKLGGRIVAIHMHGKLGQVKLGRRWETGVGWRRIFDAGAPVLAGFALAKAFEF